MSKPSEGEIFIMILLIYVLYLITDKDPTKHRYFVVALLWVFIGFRILLLFIP